MNATRNYELDRTISYTRQQVGKITRLTVAVAEVVYLRQSEIETAPNVGADEHAKFIRGVCNKNDQLLILIDLDKMLTDDEWAEVDDI